jgi:hypothetical protein
MGQIPLLEQAAQPTQAVAVAVAATQTGLLEAVAQAALV